MFTKDKQIKSKKNFSFYGPTNAAKIYIKCTYSNIFISLTDNKDKFIICCSSGSLEFPALSIEKKHHKL